MRHTLHYAATIKTDHNKPLQTVPIPLPTILKLTFYFGINVGLHAYLYKTAVLAKSSEAVTFLTWRFPGQPEDAFAWEALLNLRLNNLKG